MNNILISLVSDQTIPNVQLIKELKNETDGYLFITTDGMEKKGVRQALINACNIQANELLDKVIIDPFSFDDIEAKLDRIDFEKFEKINVNLTGGTKVMILAAFDYFKDVGANIYYLTGSKGKFIRLWPGRTKKELELRSKVNINEYLESYGFELKERDDCAEIPYEFTEGFFEKYVNGDFDDYRDNLFNTLRGYRNKKYINISSIEKLSEFISKFKFPVKDSGKLNKYEIRFLTGEWFEEYVLGKIKNELNLDANFIKSGVEIIKVNKDGNKIINEIDVLFVWDNNIYIIECKTSVLNPVVMPDGKTKFKSIIGETIYKSDSLRHGLGLFANTYLFTLDSIIEQKDKHKNHLDRANLLNIKVIDKDLICKAANIIELLSIKT